MIKLELPIYWQENKKKIVLIGMNKYRNWHYYTKNRFKKEYDELIKQELFAKGYKEIKGVYEIKYKLYYKNTRCDLMNVVSIVDKVLNDTLQDMEIIANDNVNYFKKVSAEVMRQDRENPRVEIEVKEIEEWKH